MGSRDNFVAAFALCLLVASGLAWVALLWVLA